MVVPKFHANNSLRFRCSNSDDNIVVGKGSWDNLWCITSIFRFFQLVSGLKVNFHKIKLYDINLKDDFMEAAASFLSCSTDVIPFKFMGIPVGITPRKRRAQVLVIDNVRKTVVMEWSVGFGSLIVGAIYLTRRGTS